MHLFCNLEHILIYKNSVIITTQNTKEIIMIGVLKILSWLLLIIVFAIIIFIVINWEPDRSVNDLKGRWAQAPSQFIDVAGMKIHLRDEGPRDDPTPIVLLHGTSASLHTWDGWVERLKDERRVIRFDMPGFGLTGPSPNNDYTMENYTATVIAVLDYLNVKSVVLGGNSLGGNVSWNTAVRYPDRVERLVLVDSSGYQFKPTSIPIGFKIARIPMMNKLMEKVLPRGIVEDSVKNVYGNPLLVTPELVDRYFDLTTRTGNRQALAYRLNQMQPGQFVERLSEIKIPTLILWGDKDQLIPLEMGLRFDKDIKNSQLVRFNNLGHVPQEENPTITVAVLKEFLSQ